MYTKKCVVEVELGSMRVPEGIVTATFTILNISSENLMEISNRNPIIPKLCEVKRFVFEA